MNLFWVWLNFLLMLLDYSWLKKCVSRPFCLVNSYCYNDIELLLYKEVSLTAPWHPYSRPIHSLKITRDGVSLHRILCHWSHSPLWDLRMAFLWKSPKEMLQQKPKWILHQKNRDIAVLLKTQWSKSLFFNVGTRTSRSPNGPLRVCNSESVGPRGKKETDPWSNACHTGGTWKQKGLP